MSLRFVFGGSGSGKSTSIYEEILKRAENEPRRNFLIIVPDQFTMQTQKELVLHKANTHHGIMNIDVLSFGRLSHRIFEEVGRSTTPVLDDTGKSLILRKVAGSMKEQLPYLGSNLDKQGYIHEVKSAISEFMQYGISVSDMDKLLDYAEHRGALFYKLRDLKLLYQGFMQYIHERYVTTEETLDQLCQALEKSSIVKDSVVVFDGFTGFTPIQNRVIEKFLTLKNEVIMTITLDSKEDPFKLDSEQKLFHLSKKTVSDLCKICKVTNSERVKDLYIDYKGQNRFSNNPALMHLEHALFRYPLNPYTEDLNDSIVLVEASDIKEEVRQAGIRMQKLIQDEGYQYREIAVVAGNLESYAEIIRTEFALLGIPCFIDRTRGIVLNPLIEYIKSGLEVLIRDFSYVSVFQYLRSGLAGFSPEEIDLLEMYCLKTGIRGLKKWSEQFTRKLHKDDDIEDLNMLNSMRECLMTELSPLLARQDNRGAAYVKALYYFLTQNHAAEKMAAYEAQFASTQDNVREKEYAQSYRLVMELLEQIIGLLKDETMELKEFKDILEAGFLEIEVGAIPQNVDRVVVGDIERTRLKEIKVLFFVGVNDGNIPKMGSKGGIISDIDREFLNQSDIELAPTPRQQMYIQRFYLYLNMTKPSQKLYLSFARTDGEGNSIRPSYLCDTMKQLFPKLTITYPELAPMIEQIMTPREGLSYLAKSLREYAQYGRKTGGEEQFFTLYKAYQKEEDQTLVLQVLTQAAFKKVMTLKLPKAIAQALYGKILKNSITRLQMFASCAYSHFLKYGIELKERDEFAFESVDMGNVFHGVLEGFSLKLEESDYTWFDVPDDYMRETVASVLSLYAAEYGDTILYSSARNEYAIKRIERILLRTVKTIKYQLRKGSFKPEQYEVSFSSVGDLESVNIALSDEERLQLMGRIDRVDTCESEGNLYVKVVDYKSAEKKFDLAALYYGLNLQLVVYMNAAVELEQHKHPDLNVIPAAMLYYHVSDPAVDEAKEMTPEEINAAIIQKLKTTGVVNSDLEIIKRLDGEIDTESDVIPVKFNKGGTMSTTSNVLDTNALQELSQFVNHKIRQIGKDILSGDISLLPYEKGLQQACTYCPYKNVCGFDESIPGCTHKVLPVLNAEASMEAILEENGKDGE